MKQRTGLVLFLLFLLSGLQAQPVQSAFQLKGKIKKEVSGQYLLYLPKDYRQSTNDWPLVLFLHGSGERGTDLELVKKHGPPMLVEQGKEFPFILVSPQCPEGRYWSTEFLDAVLQQVQKKYRVDEDRVYVTGLSMGGYGVWALALEYPDRFAAIAPVCGGGVAQLLAPIQDLPAWVFHGEDDDIVPLKESQEMVVAYRKLGKSVRFTVYPGVKHDSWVQAYNDPELYEWLLEQKR